MKSKEAELMQKRFRVGAGPSSNTCPRWAEHLEHRTSVRTKPGRVKTSNIFAPTLIHTPGPFTNKPFIYISHWTMDDVNTSEYDVHRVRVVRMVLVVDVTAAAARVQPAAIQEEHRRDRTRRGSSGCEDKCILFIMRIPEQLRWCHNEGV